MCRVRAEESVLCGLPPRVAKIKDVCGLVSGSLHLGSIYRYDPILVHSGNDHDVCLRVIFFSQGEIDRDSSPVVLEESIDAMVEIERRACRYIALNGFMSIRDAVNDELPELLQRS